MENRTINIPSQSGKTAIVTGATSGLGYETALALAKADAQVILAARNEEKAGNTISHILKEYPQAKLRFMQIDTSSLSSVRSFAEQWRSENKKIDMLILNAGISNVPAREVTADGFERQLATNYLGHFALTGLLLPYVKQEKDSRIVLVSSLSHKRTQLHFDDLQLEKAYNPMVAYSQSKLAVLTFAFELAERMKESGSPISVIPAHPGVAATGITRGGDRVKPIIQKITKRMFGLVGQTAAEGALPIIYAAASPDAQSGVFYGPDGRGERKGSPAPASFAPYAADRKIAGRLWTASEKLTGVHYEI